MPAPGTLAPGAFVPCGRAAYYRAEARRIDTLAAEAAADHGREHFAKVAQEYRLLADRLDAPFDDEDDDLDGDDLAAGPLLS